MLNNREYNNGVDNVKGIHIGIIASILLSIGIIMMKIVLGQGITINLLINPLFIISLVFGALGVVLMQVALKKEKSVIIMPLINSLGVLFPSLIGIIFLGEELSLLKIIALIFIIIGSFLIS